MAAQLAAAPFVRQLMIEDSESDPTNDNSGVLQLSRIFMEQLKGFDFHWVHRSNCCQTQLMSRFRLGFIQESYSSFFLYPTTQLVNLDPHTLNTKQTMGSLEDQLFRLKFATKSFERSARKAEKAAKDEKLKVKKAMEKGNMDGARIYAQNAIRKQNEYMNHLRLASRLDAVASRLDTAVKMNAVGKAMGGIVVSLDKALSQMDVTQISTVMDQFEKQFEDLDVRSAYMENAMGSTTALSTPADEVEALMTQVADEHGLAVSAEMSKVNAGGQKELAVDKESDDLSARLAKLQKGK